MDESARFGDPSTKPLNTPLGASKFVARDVGPIQEEKGPFFHRSRPHCHHSSRLLARSSRL